MTATTRAEPLRTCVGCRVRAAKSDMLRIVAGEGELVPDPRGRLPGRGAHLHPDRHCLGLAERRRSFVRALRQPGPLDTAALWRYVEEQEHGGTNTSDITSRRTGSGSTRR